jgi:potassium/chloride transporter 4/5/6
MTRNKEHTTSDGKLGAFVGVFTPTVLTILGVILYLRLGWVTGQMGLAKTLAIVIAANLITLITTLSFSAIATNIRVGAGGAYYIISRSLGLEFGGAIGLPLFLSQAFSVTLYGFGLAEAIRIIWPQAPMQLTAFAVVAVVGAISFKGAGLALRIQLPLMGLIALSLGALVVGALRGRAPVALVEEAFVPVGFWVVFAVFFPAVTGIMAGLGLSGDLRDPVRAIPRGALTATLVGFAVYLAVPFVLVFAASPEALRSDPLIWIKIAPLGAILVMPGLFGAIFSSAIGSMLGAPRTLQAMATDGVVPGILGRLSGKDRQPVVGLVFSLGIALGAVALGDLNAVAPIVTMFFLTVYGMVNVVAALETLSGDPSWRPRLSVHWSVSLLGGLACIAVMFLIHPPVATAAIVIEILLWALLTRRERKAGWGDVRRGAYESLIRWSLIRLAGRPMTARNWRPHVLTFVDDPERRLDLIRLGSWFSQGRGVVTVCELVVGDLIENCPAIEQKEERIRKMLDREHVVAFGEVDVVRDIISGMTDVAQANGIAGLDSNTILLGWPREKSRMVEFLQVVERLGRLKKSAVIARVQPGLIPRPGEERAIHVWWGGLHQNADLMLLLAHLLTRNPEWRDSTIRVLSIASNELMRDQTQRYLEEFIPQIRISAEVSVIIPPKDKAVREIIHQESADADVVLLGLRGVERGAREEYAQRIYDLAEPLRTVLFVKNSSVFVGKLIQKTDELAAVEKEPEAETVGEVSS